MRKRRPGSIDEAPSIVDANDLRPAPVTPRGVRTRAKLVAAARVVFERDGYSDARLTDITAQAGCSTGSFYTYFSSKDEILQAVIEAAQHDMLHPGMPRLSEESSSPEAIIRASNRAYLEAYERNARLMLILEQVAAMDPKFREARRRRGQAFAERNAVSIQQLQKQGLVDPDLDPMLSALALSGMVGRLAYQHFALGSTNATMAELVDTSTRLWVNALKLRSADDASTA